MSSKLIIFNKLGYLPIKLYGIIKEKNSPKKCSFEFLVLFIQFLGLSGGQFLVHFITTNFCFVSKRSLRGAVVKPLAL